MAGPAAAREVLHVELGRSPALALIVALSHLGALSVLWPVSLPLWARAGLALAVLASLAHHLRREALRTAADSVTRLEIASDLSCVAETRSGQRFEGRVSGASFVSPWLVVVVLETGRPWRGAAVVVMPDAAGPDAQRRLRTWLRWRAPGSLAA